MSVATCDALQSVCVPRVVKWLLAGVAFYVLGSAASGQSRLTVLCDQAARAARRGDYKKAHEVLQGALAAGRAGEGWELPLVLRSIGDLQTEQGEFPEGQRAYWMAEQAALRRVESGTFLPSILNNRGNLCRIVGRYAEAESLIQRALTIRQRVSRTSPYTAISMYTLGALYLEQSRLEEAKPLLEAAVAILKKKHDRSQPDWSSSLRYLSEWNRERGSYAEAESLCRESLALAKKAFGANNVTVAASLATLAHVLVDQRNYADAKTAAMRSLEIRRNLLKPWHPDFATTLHLLAKIHSQHREHAQAEALYTKAVEALQALSTEHPRLVPILRSYADLMKETNRPEDGIRLNAYADRIEQKRSAPEKE